jgi:hypothetical protein
LVRVSPSFGAQPDLRSLNLQGDSASAHPDRQCLLMSAIGLKRLSPSAAGMSQSDPHWTPFLPTRKSSKNSQRSASL